MAKLSRRPNAQPRSETGSDKAKKYNQGLRYVQGQLVQVNTGSNDFSINLTSSGKMLLGISIIPIANADISNCLITFNVNNNVLLKTMGTQNANPNYVQNMIFFPTPQPLTGKDTLNGVILNNSGVNLNVIMNVFYVSSLGNK